ncbi:hypothetical protein [Streptomyces sp. NPDC059850]|uniref:hypothetical protein n=1 Tax=Streptomyces sp. NPDC059850 TaxID=3346970 RepID=UPI003667EC15
MEQWVNPERAALVELVDQLRAPAPQPDEACGCKKRRGGLPATVFVEPDGKVLTVGCNRCGGTGIAP